MSRLAKTLFRAWAFVAKEFNEVRRQPRLILALILGPFAILLLFGIGYQGETSRLTAVVVIPKEGGYSTDAVEYGELAGGQLDVVGVTDDEDTALAQLRGDQIDLVVVVPENVGEQISAGSQVRLPVYMNEIDPVRREGIRYLTYFYATEINKRTVAAAASQGQESASDLRSALVRMRNSLDIVEQRLSLGDVAGARNQVGSIQGSTTNTLFAVAIMSQLMASDTTLIKPPSKQDPSQINIAEGERAANRLSTDVEALRVTLEDNNPDPATVRQRVGAVRTDIDTMDRLTQQFQSINPLVLAAPFYADAQNKALVETNFATFYGPGVLVLLLQHIGVTLGSLSMVRERLLGTVELFRVAPIRAGEILVGKYVSFLLTLGAIAVVLLFLMSNDITVAGVSLNLGVPLLGDPWMLAATLALVVFASLGLGFVISSISKTESQAVQLSMLVLITSVFFGGFLLRLEAIWEPVRLLSYLLPVTFGIISTQDIMLRGLEPDWMYLGALGGIGLLLAILSFLLFRRELRRR